MVNMCTLKLESPPCIEGEYDIEKIESWVYQIENHFVFANVQNESLKARYAILLVI